jgi:hypothetical protein
MKYMMTFLGLFMVCLIAYIVLWMGVSAGQILSLACLMMPFGLGMGAFFILFLVCLVFKK